MHYGVMIGTHSFFPKHVLCSGGTHVLGVVKLSGYVCGGYCSLFWVVTGTFTHPDPEQSQGSKDAL